MKILHRFASGRKANILGITGTSTEPTKNRYTTPEEVHAMRAAPSSCLRLWSGAVGGWGTARISFVTNKYDQIMKHRKTGLYVLTLVAVCTMALHSCTKEKQEDPKKGCKDPQSLNYDPAAEVDDGTCKYAYTEFVGTYSVSDSYEGSECGPATRNYFCTVTKGVGNADIVLSDFGGPSLLNVKFRISGNTIDDDGVTFLSTDDEIWNVMASGEKNGNTMFIDYSLSDLEFANNCGFLGGSMTMTKQ